MFVTALRHNYILLIYMNFNYDHIKQYQTYKNISFDTLFNRIIPLAPLNMAQLCMQ